jgi:transcriptional regulator with XRE-family HTH domain
MSMPEFGPAELRPGELRAVAKARDMAAPDRFTERLRSAVTQSGGATYVAQSSGIPLSTLNNYLAGRSEPKRLALAALARVLRRDLAWLSTGDGPGDEKESAQAAIEGADPDLLNQITDAVLALYAELGRAPGQSGLGRKCAQIHNAIIAIAMSAHEQRRMLDLALALHRQELTGNK